MKNSKADDWPVVPSTGAKFLRVHSVGVVPLAQALSTPEEELYRHWGWAGAQQTEEVCQQLHVHH